MISSIRPTAINDLNNNLSNRNKQNKKKKNKDQYSTFASVLNEKQEEMQMVSTSNFDIKA